MMTILCALLGASVAGAVALNDRPIIAVLTQPSGTETNTSNSTNAYIAASYVKFVESAGARAVPLHYDLSDKAIQNVLARVNGVLLPGGGSDFSVGTQMRRAGTTIYNYAVSASQKGDVFPIWGTCLGFQFLAVLASDDSILCPHCFDTEGVPLPLDFTPTARDSLLFRGMPVSLYAALGSENITENSHHDGIRPQQFQSNKKLSAAFTVLSTNADDHGQAFASTFIGNSLPFAATQWHPEKANFEWGTQLGLHAIPHSAHAVAVSQYMANYFVGLARQSQHRYPSAAEENAALIYNYSPVRDPNHYFTQVYIFPQNAAQ